MLKDSTEDRSLHFATSLLLHKLLYEGYFVVLIHYELRGIQTVLIDWLERCSSVFLLLKTLICQLFSNCRYPAMSNDRALEGD